MSKNKKPRKAKSKTQEARIRFPKSIDQIKLSTAMKIDAVVKSEKMSDFAKMFTVVSLFTNNPVEKLAEFPIKAIKNIYDIAMNVILNPPDVPFQRFIKIDGVEFGFIPDIDAVEGSEFMDLDNLSEGGFANYNKMLAILYRPILVKVGERYTLTSYMKEDNAIKKQREILFLKHMSYQDARSGLAFFLTFSLKSMN